MNLLDTYNNCLKELTIYINNFEYEIKLLTVLLQMLKIDTDNPIFQMMINTLSNNTYGFIKDLKIIIDDNKQIVSEACLHNKSHLPCKELKLSI